MHGVRDWVAWARCSVDSRAAGLQHTQLCGQQQQLKGICPSCAEQRGGAQVVSIAAFWCATVAEWWVGRALGIGTEMAREENRGNEAR